MTDVQMHNEEQLLTPESERREEPNTWRLLRRWDTAKGRMLANPHECRIGAVAQFTRHNLLRLVLLKLKEKRG